MDNTDDILKNYRGKYSQYWIERWGLIPELPTSFDNANSVYELVAWLQRAFTNLLDDFQQLESEFEDFKNALVDLLEYLIPELIRRYHDSAEFRAVFIILLEDILAGEERTWVKDLLKELIEVDMREWIENYLKDLYGLELNKTNANLAQTRKWVNVKNFGAKGDNKTFDADAINNAIIYAEENDMNVYIPSGTYLLDKPVELKSQVSVTGENFTKTVLKKTTATTTADGINAVMVGILCNNFELKGFTLQGDRTSYAEGNTVTTDGIHLESSSYFKVDGIRVSMCKIGFVSNTNWCCVYERTVAVQCQSYGYRLSNSSTSHLFLQPTSWGCGGGFEIVSCIYTTIINPVNDHSDAGGRPDDPFLPDGSGGNYLDPSHIFYVSGSSVAIISPGTEDSSSHYLYNEGSTVDLINPYIWGNTLHKTGTKFIQNRGTARSITNITNPDFRDIKTTLSDSTVNYFFNENSSKQKIKINMAVIPDPSFQANAVHGIDGVVFSDTKKNIDVTEHTVYQYMKIPFEYDNSLFSVTPNGKKLKVRKIATGSTESELLIPLKQGQYCIKQRNSSSSQYSPVGFELIRKNINGVEVIHNFKTNTGHINGGIFGIEEDDYNLRIRLSHSTDVLDFDTLVVEEIL